MNLQAVEGNALDAEDVAMSEMFEREGWSDEPCLQTGAGASLGQVTGADDCSPPGRASQYPPQFIANLAWLSAAN